MKNKRVGRARRIGRAGKQVWCDVRGHRWSSKMSEDGQRYLECRRCGLLRYGTPVPSSDLPPL
jgi:hypothetical protein